MSISDPRWRKMNDTVKRVNRGLNVDNTIATNGP